MNAVQRPAAALPSGPLPGRTAVWVVAMLAVLLGLVLVVAVPRVLTVPSGEVDCSFGSPSYSTEVCGDEPPQEEQLVTTGDAS